MRATHTCTFHEPDGSRVSAVRWTNPDGSVGGWVAQSAKIDPTAIVEFNAFVGPKQVVKAGEVVREET
jgi:hypothetical protein